MCDRMDDKMQAAFALVFSESEGERAAAAHAMFRIGKRSGKHPSDFKVVDAKDAPRSLDDAIAGVRAELKEEYAERLQEAREGAASARAYTSRLLAEKQALEEKLKRARAKPTHPYADDGKHETKLTAKLTGDAVFALALDVIVGRIAALDREQTRRSGNMTAEIDLPRGEYVAALHRKYEEEYGQARRGSNRPTWKAYVTQHVGKSADWCGICYKAYMIVLSDEWPEIEAQWDGHGGARGIVRAAKEHAGHEIKPPRHRRTAWRYDALTDAIRAKQFENAAQMVEAWDAES